MSKICGSVSSVFNLPSKVERDFQIRSLGRREGYKDGYQDGYTKAFEDVAEAINFVKKTNEAFSKSGASTVDDFLPPQIGNIILSVFLC